jgi:hypothetical protein
MQNAGSRPALRDFASPKQQPSTDLNQVVMMVEALLGVAHCREV